MRDVGRPVKACKLLQSAASVARRLELLAAWEQASAVCYSEEAAAPPDTGPGVAGGSGPLATKEGKMRIPRFQGLRGRLSYANVMATLALFFALTGGALAAAPYIVASDVIPATSDLAGSTYRNPLIANGKITSAMFAPTAKAPDADKLDGIDSTQFLSGYGTGEVSAGSTVSVPAGAQATAGSWCPSGKQPLGGGYFAETGNSALRTVSAAFGINDALTQGGFLVTMANEGVAAESFHVQVRCAKAASPFGNG